MKAVCHGGSLVKVRGVGGLGAVGVDVVQMLDAVEGARHIRKHGLERGGHRKVRCQGMHLFQVVRGRRVPWRWRSSSAP